MALFYIQSFFDSLKRKRIEQGDEKEEEMEKEIEDEHEHEEMEKPKSEKKQRPLTQKELIQNENRFFIKFMTELRNGGFSKELIELNAFANGQCLESNDYNQIGFWVALARHYDRVALERGIKITTRSTTGAYDLIRIGRAAEDRYKRDKSDNIPNSVMEALFDKCSSCNMCSSCNVIPSFPTTPLLPYEDVTTSVSSAASSSDTDDTDEVVSGSPKDTAISVLYGLQKDGGLDIHELGQLVSISNKWTSDDVMVKFLLHRSTSDQDKVALLKFKLSKLAAGRN